MVNTTEPINPDADLLEVATRHDNAIAAMGLVLTSLDTIPVLSAEVRRLRARLASTQPYDANLSNLIAAARATLSADSDGEPDPLFYLRDELQAQGQLQPEHGERP